MRLGIFSKLGASGGSEHRTVEMANAIVSYTSHECWVFCERELNDYLKKTLLDERVELVENVFQPQPNPTAVELMYDMDSLLVVNTDSYSFSKLDYWEGRMDKHHNFVVDVSRFKQMVFLYNFVFKVAKNLPEIRSKCPDVRIITANQEWYDRVDSDENYAVIRDYPRMVLHSLIDPKSIDPEKTPSYAVRIGKHSKPHGYKHNPEHLALMTRVNARYGDFVAWDFMGVPSSQAAEIRDLPNVTIRDAFSMPVKDYLKGIDLFLFFIKWERFEPWSRCVAEAMMSGCPILAPNKGGNIDQVQEGDNGFLFSDLDQAEERLCTLIASRALRQQMGQRSREIAQDFTSDKIVQKYLDFIQEDMKDTKAVEVQEQPAMQATVSPSTEVSAPVAPVFAKPSTNGFPMCITVFSLWRSGSSWLEDMLGKKVEGSRLFGHEQQLWPLLSMMRQAYAHSSPSSRTEANRPVDEIDATDFHSNFGLKFAKVIHNAKRYSKVEFYDLAMGFIRLLLGQYTEYKQVVEKSPESIVPESFSLAYQLLSDQPGFRIVYLFRDFRPYLASCHAKFVKKGKKEKQNLEYFARCWIDWNLHALDVVAARPARNIYVLEYDDMVHNQALLDRFAVVRKQNPEVRSGTLDKWKSSEALSDIERLYESSQQAVDAILVKCRELKIR